MERGVAYKADAIVFSEKEEARGIFIVLEGEVLLSISSSEGKRLSLRIARKGDLLGLSSSLSGNPYDVTAQALYPLSCHHSDDHTQCLHFLSREISRSLPCGDGRIEQACDHSLRTTSHRGAHLLSFREAGSFVSGLDRGGTRKGIKLAPSLLTGDNSKARRTTNEIPEH